MIRRCIVPLLLGLLAAQAWAQTGSTPQPAQGGWQGLVRVLNVLTPSVDTSITPTAAQVADRVTTLLARGLPEAALQAIAAHQPAPSTAPGIDVQLLFLKARALVDLQQYQEAVAIYHDMTERYPELPEPWNNLAAEYVRQGQLQWAQHALRMALASDPHYTAAQANLAVVERLLK